MDMADRQIAPQPVFEATVTDIRYSKPPLAVLTVDVVIRNNEAHLSWVVIPSTIPHIPGPSGSGVYGVETFAVGASQGGAVVGQLHGIEGSYVVLMPQSGELKLKGLPIYYWQPDQPTDSVEIIVRMTNELFIGEEPMQQWFEVNPLNQTRVEGDYGKRRLLERRERQGYQELPLILTDETRVGLVVPLAAPKISPDLPLP